jgi:hypothetical protein
MTYSLHPVSKRSRIGPFPASPFKTVSAVATRPRSLETFYLLFILLWHVSFHNSPRHHFGRKQLWQGTLRASFWNRRGPQVCLPDASTERAHAQTLWRPLPRRVISHTWHRITGILIALAMRCAPFPPLRLLFAAGVCGQDQRWQPRLHPSVGHFVLRFNLLSVALILT